MLRRYYGYNAMMDSIFAKLTLFFASILGLVSTPAYIQLNTASIVFTYKTGESRPLYYLNVKNIGPQKERFDVSANVPWVFISREGYDSATSLNLEREGAVNFALDIRPEMVVDGSHSGEIIVKAVDVYDYSVLETKTVEVTLNKNFIPTPLATPTLSVSSIVLLTPTPTSTPTQLQSPIVTEQAPKITPKTTPKVTIFPTPIIRITVSPTASPPTRLRSVVTPMSSISASPQAKAGRVVSPFRSFWQFLRNFIF